MTRSIAIVGGGASGLSLSNQIIRKLMKNRKHYRLSITLFEKKADVGPGNAYRMDLKSNLMNTQTRTLDQRFGEGFGLVDFLLSNPSLMDEFDVDPVSFVDEFIPRPLFGLYLKAFAEHIAALAQRHGVTFKVVHDEVVDLSRADDSGRYSLHTASEPMTFDFVYLCQGHLNSNKDERYVNNDQYTHSVYTVAGLIAKIPKTASVGILGTRLSAIDAIIALRESGHQSAIHCHSRSGRLPAIRSLTQVHTPQILNRHNLEVVKRRGEKISLSKLGTMLAAEINLAEGKELALEEILQSTLNAKEYYEHEVNETTSKGHRPYQAAMYSTNTCIDLMWQLLDDTDKHIFLRRFFSLWMSYRASIPLKNGQKILSHLQRGNLSIHAQLKSHRYNAQSKKFELLNHEGVIIAEVDCLINAMGSPSDVAKSDDLLIHKLLARDLVAKDPFGGLKVDYRTGAVIDPITGTANKKLFVLGPITSGTYFTTTVLEVIERQAKDRASQLQHTLEELMPKALETPRFYLNRDFDVHAGFWPTERRLPPTRVGSQT